jgi:hypothetical protein
LSALFMAYLSAMSSMLHPGDDDIQVSSLWYIFFWLCHMSSLSVRSVCVSVCQVCILLILSGCDILLLWTVGGTNNFFILTSISLPNKPFQLIIFKVKGDLEQFLSV